MVARGYKEESIKFHLSAMANKSRHMVLKGEYRPPPQFSGNFFKWKDQFYNQISGCALGDPDSCSYTDITMADLLDKMVPACQETVSTNMDPFF